MKRVLFLLCILANMFVAAHAQIGYQIALLNTATGEARANTSVNATVTITDSANGVVYTGTQRVTSNDFGILSLVIGDANTFSNVDTSKMPFFIEVSVDGTLIGKSQILSVPVAEVAKRLKSSLSVEDLVGSWMYSETPSGYGFSRLVIFTSDGKWSEKFWERYHDPNGNPKEDFLWSGTGRYEIEGDEIIMIADEVDVCATNFDRARIVRGNLVFCGSGVFLKKQ